MGFLQPLAACGVMAAVALGARAALIGAGLSEPGLILVAMIVTGAVTYVAAALVICRATALDLLDLLRRALSRRAPILDRDAAAPDSLAS
jgi:hypothetical protein